MRRTGHTPRDMGTAPHGPRHRKASNHHHDLYWRAEGLGTGAAPTSARFGTRPKLGPRPPLVLRGLPRPDVQSIAVSASVSNRRPGTCVCAASTNSATLADPGAAFAIFGCAVGLPCGDLVGCFTRSSVVVRFVDRHWTAQQKGGRPLWRHPPWYYDRTLT
jgi:hypothetical protein